MIDIVEKACVLSIVEVCRGNEVEGQVKTLDIVEIVERSLVV